MDENPVRLIVLQDDLDSLQAAPRGEKPLRVFESLICKASFGRAANAGRPAGVKKALRLFESLIPSGPPLEDLDRL